MRYMDWNKLEDLGRARTENGWQHIVNPRADKPRTYRLVHGSRHYLIAVMPIGEGIGERCSDPDHDHEALFLMNRTQLNGLVPLTEHQGRALQLGIARVLDVHRTVDAPRSALSR